MENIQQYQRAVTPTMGTGNAASDKVRGKMLSYSARRGGSSNMSDAGSARGGQQHLPQPAQSTQRAPRTSASSQKSLQIGQSLEISGQSKPVSGNRVAASNSRQDIYGLTNQDISREFNKITNYLPHQDLEPLSDSVPPDGVLFARFRNRPGSLVVFRLHDERARNPERLNLDRRQLDICPHLEQEQRLRLLNFQNNNIRLIQNLENLPNLIFLDLYNNKLSTLEGSLSTVRGLRVLMVGKNRISEISNISNLKKLDVLDLHSNDISEIQGLDGLQDLRVLNLAGNCIPVVHNISMLSSLTELNLRRNNIEQVLELDRIPSLQRVFLSHNRISLERNIACLYSLHLLIELSLDANPIAEESPDEYRILIIGRIPSLKHLDLRRVSEEEKSLARDNLTKVRPVSELFSSLTSSQLEAPVTSETQLENRSRLPGQLPHHDTDPRREGDAHLSGSLDEDESPQVLHSNSSDHGDGGTGQKQRSSGSVGERTSIVSRKDGQASPDHFFPPSNGDFKSALPQNAFDLETIGNNEKSLIVIGENWEWAHSKRMLSSVTETCLRHMKKETIVSKFAANLAWLPGLKSLTLIDNDIKTFADFNIVIRSFCGPAGGGIIKHLYIADNPLCQISPFLLKSFVAVTIPQIESINGSSITLEEKEVSSNVFKVILRRSGQSVQDGALVSIDSHWCKDRNLQPHRCSLDSRSSGICFHENAWTSNLFDKSDINYSQQLLESSGADGSEIVKRAMNTLPPPQTSFSSISYVGTDGSGHRRGDLEYKFPYKSSHQTSSTRVSSVAPIPSSFQMHLNSISAITQFVLQRRSVEEKFTKLFDRTIDSTLLETIGARQGGTTHSS